MATSKQEQGMEDDKDAGLNEKLDNDYDAFVLALTLAITAESDEKYAKVVPMLELLRRNFDEATIERAKKESIERVKELDALR
jgi:hypothetical protein